MTPEKQVSPAIRILRGERDASARATHLEAATRKFLVTTNERKYMSTKTNFKRIALVAVAALGLGVLSSVPSQAAASNLTIDVVDGTATTVKSDSTTAGTVDVKGLLGVAASDSIGVVVVLKSRPATADAITPILLLQDTLTGSVANAVKENDGSTSATGFGSGTATTGIDSATATSYLFLKGSSNNTYQGLTGYVILDTATVTGASRTNIDLVAGTYVVTVIATPFTSTVAGSTAGTAISKDISIVVSATADASKTATATYAFSKLTSSSSTRGSVTDATDAVISAPATVGSTAQGFIYVAVRNASDAATVAQDSLTAVVTGSGLVCTGSATPAGSTTAGTCGKSLSKIAATGDYEFVVTGDGTGGTSTITITSLVTGLSYTHSLSYYAASAKTLTASVFTPVLKIGANDSAISVTAVDAAGAVWGGTAYIVASAAADATAVGGSATTPVACTFRTANSTHYCPISAVAAGSGKFKVIDAATVALATATSNEVTVKSSTALAATVKISFNKANYAPGETGMIMITPLDAAGGAMPAGSVTTNALASGGITSDVGLSYNAAAVTLTGTEITTAAYTSSTTVAGSQVIFFNAPLGGGKITLTAKGGTGLPVAGQVALTATATVTDNGAAALAAVTALATTVASLKTLITTLTNLVLKIQKKVKA
jgi:hypothetical protein